VTFLRDVWADLVDKRLWPVAVALALALVAIPVLLVQSPAQPKAPAPAMADAGPAPLVTDPASIASARPSGPVVGDAHNPFKQQHVPKAAGAGTSTSGAGAGPGTTPSGGTGPASSGGPNVPAPSLGGGGSDGGRRPSASGERRLKVRFGPTEGRRRVRVLTEGAPLPSVSNPAVLFVAARAGGKIEFIVSSDAVAQGDGTCEPNKAICSQLFLRAGDTEFFDVTRTNGKVVQYQLDVLDVLG
jgi:hypothetical protein